MKVKRFLGLAALFCSCALGCKMTRYVEDAVSPVSYLEDISQVSYSEESGTILPELQLYEQIVITRDGVTLTRNGRTEDTEVNEDTWEITVDEQKVTAFFEQLEAIDCSSIEEIEPDEPTIGGDTETYTILYAGDARFSLAYGQGTTYTDGALIVEPIEAFIRSLEFPAGAASQYKDSIGQPTAVPPTPAPTGSDGDTASLTIVNSSGVEIRYVYLAPSFSDEWSDDWLGGDAIAAGERLTLSGIPFGVYDVRAETADHVVLDTWFNRPLDGPMTWEVWGGDGSGWIPRIDQWATSASASSEYGDPDGGALQATGEPDTAEWGDYRTAWASAAPDGVDWLELGYEFPVIPGRINVYESCSPGFIVRVEVVDEWGYYHTVWEGEPSPVEECPRVFSIPVVGLDVPVVGVRIHLDQRAGDNWNEAEVDRASVDAVQLIGTEV